QHHVGAAGDQLQLAPWRSLRPGVFDRRLQPPYQLFLRTTLAGTPTAVAPSGTSFVTTEPAPVREPLPSLTGATSIVSTPTNAPAPIWVLFLTSPLEVAVIVPAPTFASSATAASPRHQTCGTFPARP